VLFLAIPAAVGLFVWRVPLIRLLLERGEFTTSSTALTAAALMYYALGLVGHSVVEIVARAFYALHDTRTPVVIGVAAMAGNVLLSLWLRGPLGHAGLALANTIATSVEMLLMVWLLSRRLQGLEWPRLWATVIKAGIAAGLMAVALVWAAREWAGQPVLLVAPLGLAGGGLLYLVAAFVLRMPEVRTLARLGR
jgi:putative peptidoglycan lipid II flippase